MLPYVAAAACFVILFFQNSYMRDRLTEFLKGSNYVQQMLALEQQQMLAFGGGTISSYVDTESLASTYVLHSIFLWFGIVSGILVTLRLQSLYCAVFTMPCTRATVWLCWPALLQVGFFFLSFYILY